MLEWTITDKADNSSEWNQDGESELQIKNNSPGAK